MKHELEKTPAAIKKLAAIEVKFKAASAYNHDLFELYLRYIRRRRISYETCSQAQRLSDFMAREQIAPILSWEDALALDQKNPLSLRAVDSRRQGKPFRKIALMLQEIGVIGPRRDNHELSIQNYLKSFAPELQTLIAEYLAHQRSQKRSNSTLVMILNELRNLHRWLQDNRPSSHLLHVRHEDMRVYLAVVAERYSSSHLSNTYFRLSYFYRWTLDRSYLLVQAMPPKSPPSMLVKHTICSNEQLELLLNFVTGCHNDPQIAMMLALVLLYAFTREQLSTATVLWTDDQLSIFSKAKEKTFKVRAQRPDRLVMPREPRWFLDLQTRFYSDWLARRSKMRVVLDRYPLLIHEHCIDSQAVSRSWVAGRIRKGTLLATGIAIPLSVMRQTSAVIHKKEFDAAVLTRLGWASSTAMNYVWAPTVLFTPRKASTWGPSR